MIVIPKGEIFYAQKISELDIEKKFFDATKDFKKIDDVFDKIQIQDLEYYKKISLRIIDTLRNKALILKKGEFSAGDVTTYNLN